LQEDNTVLRRANEKRAGGNYPKTHNLGSSGLRGPHKGSQQYFSEDDTQILFLLAAPNRRLIYLSEPGPLNFLSGPGSVSRINFFLTIMTFKTALM